MKHEYLIERLVWHDRTHYYWDTIAYADYHIEVQKIIAKNLLDIIRINRLTNIDSYIPSDYDIPVADWMLVYGKQWCKENLDRLCTAVLLLPIDENSQKIDLLVQIAGLAIDMI